MLSPWYFLSCGVKEISGDGQSRAETRERCTVCFWAEFPLICMEDVDYDASWRALLNEVRQREAHAPNCSVIECDGYSERWLSSTRSIQHVYVRDAWSGTRGWLFIEMSLMKVGQTECAIICAHI